MFGWKRFKKSSQKSKNQEQIKNENLNNTQNQQLTSDIDYNLQVIKDKIGFNSDVTIRTIHIGQRNMRASIIYVDGLANQDLINEHILKPLMLHSFEKDTTELWPADHSGFKEYLKNHVLSISAISEVNTFEDLISQVLSGATVLLIDGFACNLVLNTQGWKTRGIEEPPTETVVRGPRIGFTETLKDNTAYLRRFTLDPNLTILNYQVGKRTKKKLIITYIKDIANPELVNEVKRRIEKIDMDDVPESGSLEQLIEDNFLSPFPQLQSTERPDRVIGALNEGRVAILLDGTPFALIAPVTFSMFIQSQEDYYIRWIPASLTRMLRFFATFLSLFLPAIYISFVSFHQGLIPSKLAFSIAGTRTGVPFPTLIEALIMEISIEILREAGLRLPKTIGQAVGIVGGLVIGEAAVQAGIVSPIMVIVVSITAISSFVLPGYPIGLTLRWLRFVVMFFAATMGLYGVILFFLLLIIHLSKHKSFGVPYIGPAEPSSLSDLKDFLVRMPLMMMKKRPTLLNPQDQVRKGSKD
ncbi:spore germination protein [Metabacillus arenae]|uniref:Spore germination protein n=1 Tax=Metabacillus arenae TaxID=2771434 RepID=A0A926RYL2_9BACI|nr:spore germination protein [Metabacillus arenae]MBD1382201.1 spore germination protein [Metabacillus arenae]